MMHEEMGWHVSPNFDPMIGMISSLMSDGDPTPREIEEHKGFFRMNCFNFDHMIREPLLLETWPGNLGRLKKEDNCGCGELNAYGVGDSEEQLISLIKPLLEAISTRWFVCSLVTIIKEDQPEEGGWRWHKWGPYIGDKKPKNEYLYNEGEDITQAVVYHIYEVASPDLIRGRR